ncbi:MAG: hypothetical protein ACOCWQ_01875 [Nanoarchaeota archaeon]
MKTIIISTLLSFLGLSLFVLLFTFFLLPSLQTELIAASQSIAQNTVELQEADQMADALAGQSLAEHYGRIMRIIALSAALAAIIQGLFGSYSWYHATGTSLPVKEFLLRYAIWAMIWFGVVFGLFVLSLSLLAYRDLALLPEVWNGILLIMLFVASYVLGYLWVHTLWAVSSRRPSIFCWHILVGRYSIFFVACAVLVGIVFLVPVVWLQLLAFLGVVIVFNAGKFLCNAGPARSCKKV